VSTLILKLDGSIISHSNRKIDFDYLREFRDFLREHVLRNKKFVVVVGGGQVAKEYIDLAKEQANIVSSTDLNWIHAAISALNATIVRAYLGDDIAELKVWKYEDIENVKELAFEKPIAVAGGFGPGKSVNWGALQIAKAFEQKKIFCLGSIDGIYTQDPKDNPKAKHIEKLSWEKYLKMLSTWKQDRPEEKIPVDITTAQEAKQFEAMFMILKGMDLENLDNAISSEGFLGTVISS
jgi:uridylate kinase